MNEFRREDRLDSAQKITKLSQMIVEYSEVFEVYRNGEENYVQYYEDESIR